MQFTCSAGGVFYRVGTLERRVHQELIVPQVLDLQIEQHDKHSVVLTTDRLMLRTRG